MIQILSAAHCLSVECNQVLGERGSNTSSNIAVACENDSSFIIATFASWLTGLSDWLAIVIHVVFSDI